MTRIIAGSPRAAARAVAALALMAACGGKQSGPAPETEPLEALFPLAAYDDRALCDVLMARDAGEFSTFVDPEPARRRKIVVSDLHLGAGDHAGPEFAGLEDFYFDDVWAGFLAAEARRGPSDLIIAGDFIDFWQILGAMGRLPERDSAVHDRSESLLAADQDSSLAALEYALVAHHRVFAAIGAFLDHGDNRVIVVAGNHDAEMWWPRVRLAVARAVGARDPRRLLFVDAEVYRHGGVHVEHGHRLDAANRFHRGHAPFGRDAAGRCRLQSSWGEVFVAHFFKRTERDFPFIDNLYPESAAILWGLRDEPDASSGLVAAARFLDLVVSAQSLDFNAQALSGAVRGVFGLPGGEAIPGSGSGPAGSAAGKVDGSRSPAGGELLAHLADRFGDRQRVLEALTWLWHDPQAVEIRDAVVDAARSLPDVGAAMARLATVDPEHLERIRARLFGDPMITAARDILARADGVRVVVFGHTHHPGGAAERVTWPGGEGYYANTGAWIPVARVRDLTARNVAWTDLSIRDRELFGAVFPAVIIGYRGDRAAPPRIVRTRVAAGAGR